MKTYYIKKVILIFLIACTNIFAFDNEIYVEVKCKNLTNSFFQAKYEDKKLYIGAMNLFYFLEIYDVNVDLDRKSVEFVAGDKVIKAKFNDDEAFVSNEELYISREAYIKKLDFKEISFSYEYLRINLFPKFKLPLDERKEGRMARLRLDNEKLMENQYKNIVFMPKKLITPGFIKLKFNKYDISSSNKGSLSYSYGNEFLFGSLYLTGSLTGKERLSYGNLKYKNIYENNDLTLGSIYIDSPNFINIENDIIGASFNTNETYRYQDGAKTIIRGEAINAKTIELYSGNFLIDYINPDNKDFVFKVDNSNISNTYTLKIYYEDGKIEKRKIYNINDMNMLKSGKSKFNLSLGKESRDGQKQFSSEVFYGINNYLTFKAGFDDLTDLNKVNYQLVKTGFLFNSREKTMPTLIDFVNYHDINNHENNYNLSITQNYKDIQFNYDREKYSKSIADKINLKLYENFSIGHTFGDNYFEIGGTNYKKKYGKHNYSKYIYWGNTYFNPFSCSLKFEDKKYSQIISPTLSYYGDFSFIIKGNFRKYKDTNRWNNYYDARLYKRNIDIIKDKLTADIGVFARYTQNDASYSYGLNFNFKLDELFNIRSYSNIDKYKNQKHYKNSSIEIEKIIDLSNPTKYIPNDNYVTQAIIYGKVFMDKNANNKFDEGDIPLKDVKITSNYKKSITDEDGNYYLAGLYGNSKVLVNVDRTSIDPMAKPVFNNLEIATNSSAKYNLDIPIQSMSIVTGNIYIDSNMNPNKFSRSISLTIVKLLKDNKVVAETKPEFDGLYVFEEVLPGDYTIYFEYLGKEGIKFTENNLKINIPLTAEGEYYENYDTKFN